MHKISCTKNYNLWRSEQHQPKSQTKTEKECHGKNEHELEVPEPKTNLNSDIKKAPFT